MQTKLKRAILKDRKKIELFKNVLGCGSKVVSQLGVTPAVFVLANEKKAKFFGTMTCKNPWYCPTCSAKVMAKYAAEIACAIEALKKQYNQVACMITFTVPHTRTMSCEEVTDILYNTWSDFITHGNKNQKVKYYVKEERYKRNSKKVMKVSDKVLSDPFASFCEATNCKHRVRAGEFTWGEHGWHPHFHCLFWVDKNKLQTVKDWEDKLNERWLFLAKKNTVKIWNRNAKVGVGLGKAAEVPEAIRKGVDDAKKNNRIRAKIMYQNLDKGSKGVYVSKDKSGAVIEQKASWYICGWGADREITGNYQNKASNHGHFTPRQLLEMANDDNNYMKLYFEYMKALKAKNRRRVNFSTNSGIKDIIKQWKKTADYIESMKKKAMSDPTKNLKVVCWFSERQWKEICFIEYILKKSIKAKILQLAILKNARQLIEELLLTYDDKLKLAPPHEAENQISDLFAASAVA